LRGEVENCRKWLEKAQASGTLPTGEHIAADTDLDNVRQCDWFQTMLKEIDSGKMVEV
jgi:hypothetical protein